MDGTQVDKTARKRIRSHVMKGKNVGRRIHRPSKLDLSRWRPCDRKHHQQASDLSGGRVNSELWRGPYLSTNIPILGNPFLTLSFPFELTPHSQKVIHHCKHGKSGSISDESAYRVLSLLLRGTEDVPFAFRTLIRRLQAAVVPGFSNG